MGELCHRFSCVTASGGLGGTGVGSLILAVEESGTPLPLTVFSLPSMLRGDARARPWVCTSCKPSRAAGVAGSGRFRHPSRAASNRRESTRLAIPHARATPTRGIPGGSGPNPTRKVGRALRFHKSERPYPIARDSGLLPEGATDTTPFCTIPRDKSNPRASVSPPTRRLARMGGMVRAAEASVRPYATLSRIVWATSHGRTAQRLRTPYVGSRRGNPNTVVVEPVPSLPIRQGRRGPSTVWTPLVMM